MADLNCTKCGKPWDLDTIVTDDPGGFERTGALIRSCPNCVGKTRPSILADMDSEEKEHTLNTCAAAAAIGDILGDDLDGAASLMEDATFDN